MSLTILKKIQKMLHFLANKLCNYDMRLMNLLRVTLQANLNWKLCMSVNKSLSERGPMRLSDNCGNSFLYLSKMQQSPRQTRSALPHVTASAYVTGCSWFWIYHSSQSTHQHSWKIRAVRPFKVFLQFLGGCIFSALAVPNVTLCLTF